MNFNSLFSVEIHLNDTEKKWILDAMSRIENSSFDIELLENTVIFSSEEGGETEAANFLQQFLKECRPNNYLSFEVALTCSRLVPGQFGGLAVVITANEQYWFSTAEFIAKKAKEICNGSR